MESAASHYCSDLVRRLDYDRYLCALFAPQQKREALLALYALNAELARIREVVHEPLLGAIRLQWWRERIAAIYAGQFRPESSTEVLRALAAAVGRHGIRHERLDALLDAREFDLAGEPPEDLPVLETYAEATAGTLARLALDVLASDNGGGEIAAAQNAARDIGAAFGLAGLLRAVPFHAAGNRVFLPKSLLSRAGITSGDVIEGRARNKLADVAAEIAARAGERLKAGRAQASSAPSWAGPALLPGALADLYLRRLDRAGYDVFHPKLTPARPLRQLRLLRAALRRRP